MTHKALFPRAKSNGENSWLSTDVVQTPTETLVAQEVDVDMLLDSLREISRFGAANTDFKRFQNEKHCRDLSAFT